MITHKRGDPMPKWKRWLILWPKWFARCLVWWGGIKWVKTERPQVDYKKFLGPQWEPKYDGASTIVFNHTTWFVCYFNIFYYH